MLKEKKSPIPCIFTLTWLLTLAACGQAGRAADTQAEEISEAHAETGIVTGLREGAMPELGQNLSNCQDIVDILCKIQECNLNIEKSALEKYKEYTFVFYPEDFVPQEIACANVFSTCQDGRQNQEILSLYEAVGEQWEYLWYVEYDYDQDGQRDYIVLHDCPDQKEGADIGGGDIWITGKDRRLELPKTTYLTGGTWQEPQFNMMLFTHAYDGLWIPSFAVYRDYAEQEMALYGWYGGYKRVRARTVVEEVSGITIRQTGYTFPYSDGYDPVRLEIMWSREGNQGYQVIMTERVRSRLTADKPNCVVWDGNDDGYEDILYYRGNDGGSGGSWVLYDLLCWSEEEQQYESMELPQCISINYEDHKLYSNGQIGAPHQFYKIYGLLDGQYQLEKELELLYGPAEDELTAVYSEYDETVEVTELPADMDWEEIKSLLEGKYPEFTFWREG